MPVIAVAFHVSNGSYHFCFSAPLLEGKINELMRLENTLKFTDEFLYDQHLRFKCSIIYLYYLLKFRNNYSSFSKFIKNGIKLNNKNNV